MRDYEFSYETTETLLSAAFSTLFCNDYYTQRVDLLPRPLIIPKEKLSLFLPRTWFNRLTKLHDPFPRDTERRTSFEVETFPNTF